MHLIKKEKQLIFFIIIAIGSYKKIGFSSPSIVELKKKSGKKTMSMRVPLELKGQ